MTSSVLPLEVGAHFDGWLLFYAWQIVNWEEQVVSALSELACGIPKWYHSRASRADLCPFYQGF
jgi:hypothetical protein